MANGGLSLHLFSVVRLYLFLSSPIELMFVIVKLQLASLLGEIS